MFKERIDLEFIPDLDNPLFIACFDGWGNALEISSSLADYMIRDCKARVFGIIDPDPFYRYDDKRPQVTIKDGILKDIDPPGGRFYVAERVYAGRDMIILKASEPDLRWYDFVDSILSLCQEAGVKTIINIGSMYDNVLHTDNVISALASSEEILSSLTEKKVIRVSYEGPGGIHSIINSEAQKKGFECLSLWCHCPYYLQGTTHFGLLARLSEILGEWGGLNLDTEGLKVAWKDMSQKIQTIIDKNPELQEMIRELRKTKMQGVWDPANKNNKIIQIEDFIKSK